MTTPAALPLASRVGLPDDLAYLRASYPQPEWRTHANFGELAAFWLQVHDSLRVQGAGLSQLTRAFREGQIGASDFPRIFVPRLNQFLDHLNGHHRIEDRGYFPKFRMLDPRMVAGFDVLERDHALIHEQLEATATGARALLVALGQPADRRRFAADAYAATADGLLRSLRQHLSDEEEIVIPAMLEHGERSVG